MHENVKGNWKRRGGELLELYKLESHENVIFRLVRFVGVTLVIIGMVRFLIWENAVIKRDEQKEKRAPKGLGNPLTS